MQLTTAVAIVFGVATAMFTTVIYVPSAIHTVLKFRTGVIPSLRDPHFLQYRQGLHQTTFMVGAMFWGLIISTFAVIGLFGGVVFLASWHVSEI